MYSHMRGFIHSFRSYLHGSTFSLNVLNTTPPAMSSSTAEKAIASIAASDELVLPPGSDDDAQNEGQLPAPCRDPDLADLSIWKTMALVGAVCLSVFLIALDYSIVTTAIPKITYASLHYSIRLSASSLTFPLTNG